MVHQTSCSSSNHTSKHLKNSLSEFVAKNAKEVTSQQIEFIPHDEFSSKQATDLFQMPSQLACEDVSADRKKTLSNLPPHLSRLCEAEVLTPDQEKALFGRMNYLKYRAEKIRCSLKSPRTNSKKLNLMLELLNEAESIRDRIIKANVRLVISVVKKFVTPQLSFDELLSEGMMTLFQAVEKFDVQRGFRFSTYVYRSVSRHAYKTVKEKKLEDQRFMTAATEESYDFEDQGNSCSMDEKTWSTLRKELQEMIGNLDRREQFVLCGRFALGANHDVSTFQSLANQLGVSKERARQLLQRAVDKLQKMARNLNVEELVGPAISV